MFPCRMPGRNPKHGTGFAFVIVVHAHDDLGPMSELTRWLPRRVRCLATPGDANSTVECVVKYQQGNHFGTLYQAGENGPVLRLSHLPNPQQVVDLWVLDCWLGTTDRKTEGNTLLVHSGGGKFDLYAVDQSDCFGGPAGLADGTWQGAMQTRGKMEDAGCLGEAILTCGGPSSVQSALQRADRAYSRLGTVCQEVPREWWSMAGITPPQMQQTLDLRYHRLRDIVRPDDWPRPDAYPGAILLGGGGEV